MSILFCFCNSELCQALVGYILAECVLEDLWLECNFNIRHCCIILSHANKVYGEETVLSLKALKIRVNKCSCNLSCSVRTEVEEDDAVVRLNLSTALNNTRNNKFVCYAVIVRVFNCTNRAVCLVALAIYHSGICLFNSVPVVISVHCVVSALNCGNLAYADFFELVKKLVCIFSGT